MTGSLSRAKTALLGEATAWACVFLIGLFLGWTLGHRPPCHGQYGNVEIVGIPVRDTLFINVHYDVGPLDTVVARAVLSTPYDYVDFQAWQHTEWDDRRWEDPNWTGPPDDKPQANFYEETDP